MAPPTKPSSGTPPVGSPVLLPSRASSYKSSCCDRTLLAIKNSFINAIEKIALTIIYAIPLAGDAVIACEIFFLRKRVYAALQAGIDQKSIEEDIKSVKIHLYMYMVIRAIEIIGVSLAVPIVGAAALTTIVPSLESVGYAILTETILLGGNALVGTRVIRNLTHKVSPLPSKP